MATTGNERHMPPVIEYFGKTLLRAIDQTVIDDAAIRLYPKASADTRNRQVYTIVSAVLKHAGVEARLKRPKGWRGAQVTAWLWPEQAFAVFEAADAIDREFGIFLRLLTYTGARLSEACALKVVWLSLAESTAYGEQTKNEDPRTYYLPPALVAELASHPRGLERPEETVFRFRKNGRLYAMLARLRKAVGPGIEITGFHMFRHTWATWMRRYGGLDTTGLLATGAWRDAASARRYEHVVVAEEARKAVLLPVQYLRKKA
jgi:integrase